MTMHVLTREASEFVLLIKRHLIKQDTQNQGRRYWILCGS